jgi:hypothetical protein
MASALRPLFDTVGRKVMITSTYVISRLILLVTAEVFHQEVRSAVTPDDLLGSDVTELSEKRR